MAGVLLGRGQAGKMPSPCCYSIFESPVSDGSSEAAAGRETGALPHDPFSCLAGDTSPVVLGDL